LPWSRRPGRDPDGPSDGTRDAASLKRCPWPCLSECYMWTRRTGRFILCQALSTRTNCTTSLEGTAGPCCSTCFIRRWLGRAVRGQPELPDTDRCCPGDRPRRARRPHARGKPPKGTAGGPRWQSGSLTPRREGARGCLCHLLLIQQSPGVLFGCVGTSHRSPAGAFEQFGEPSHGQKNDKGQDASGVSLDDTNDEDTNGGEEDDSPERTSNHLSEGRRFGYRANLLGHGDHGWSQLWVLNRCSGADELFRCGRTPLHRAVAHDYR
jgi:hypothetical protein